MSKTHISSVLRRLVQERAKGCCEYCLIPEIATFATHEIDHIIAEKHGGLTEANNLAYSCTLCNKYKGTDLTSIDPETGEIVPLYHPRQDRWQEHFLILLEISLEWEDYLPTGLEIIVLDESGERIAEERFEGTVTEIKVTDNIPYSNLNFWAVMGERFIVRISLTDNSIEEKLNI